VWHGLGLPASKLFDTFDRFISIDAAFLSGFYEGRLLMVCCYDVENQLIPLTFALVERKNLEN
jgi:hypothetical protein